jgi:hypothetical protein
MPDVDDRIRTELRGLSREVPVEGVLDRVERRKKRRRAQAVALAVAVVTGSVAGGVALTHVFGHRGTAPASQPSGPTATSPAATVPNPTSAGGSPSPEEVLCDESQLNADVDGDGALDEVALWSPAPSCDSPQVGEQWVLHVSGGKLGPSAPGIQFYGFDQAFTDCQQPAFACRLFAAPDIDGDGAAELAIRIWESASADNLALYRLEGFDTAAGLHFVRIALAPPGDVPWFPPGDVWFRWGGSLSGLDSLECRSDGDRILVASSAGPVQGDPGHYDVHETQFRLQGDLLHVEATADYPDLAPDQNPPFVTPPDLCGAPLVGGS